MKTTRFNWRARCGIALAATLIVVGYQAPAAGEWKLGDLFDINKGMPWHDDSPHVQIPVRLVGAWTDAVLHQPGRPSQRGFGGRLLFYGRESSHPVLVEGQLVVYAFDETDRDPSDNRPTRRFVFPAEQLALHMSESEFGPSYSFWLPWDEVGGPQTEVSLICRFEPRGGSLIVGEQTQHLLPGTLGGEHHRPLLPEGIPARPGARQAAYLAERDATMSRAQEAAYNQPATGMPGATAGDASASTRQMEITSISLPASFRPHGTTATARGGSAHDARFRQSPIPANQRGLQPAGVPPMGVAPAAVPLPPTGPVATPPAGYGAAAAAMPSGQTVAGQTPAPTPVRTTVSYLTPQQTLQRRIGRWSFGSAPATLPAPSPPASP